MKFLVEVDDHYRSPDYAKTLAEDIKANLMYRGDGLPGSPLVTVTPMNHTENSLRFAVRFAMGLMTQGEYTDAYKELKEALDE